jgi:L-ascorbate metabolism protein UlaG (beta-lactamase superfamily)
MPLRIFGKNPAGIRLQRIKASPNYRNNAFQNLVPTDVTLKDASYVKMMKDFIYKSPEATPPQTLPTVKTDLLQLKADKPVIVWFGHSSYMIRYKEKTILVDPVLSGQASPVSGFGKAFKGSDIYHFDELPASDLIVITHDHYDHLDYKTITRLKSKTGAFVTSLGVGSHLEHWGVPAEKITELDWWESTQHDADIHLTATPARHFSGRGVLRNKTLWSSFVLRLYDYKILIGGDSGYGDHFTQIGLNYGPFDVAILESGQYGDAWPYIHMFPEQTVQAAIDLGAKTLLPVHWGKFALAYHAWNEPIQRVLKQAEKVQMPVLVPQIGMPLQLSVAESQEIWWKM